MSNYTAFTQGYLRAVIEPFLPGGTDHITPIKYEAITPDIFAFLFRTTDKQRRDHFFVALEYDYFADVDDAKKTISDWHGSFRKFWAPDGQPESQTLDDLSVRVDQAYLILFAEVGPPRSPSYWADNRVLYPDTPLDEFLFGFDVSRRDGIRTAIEKIRRKHPDVSIAVSVNDDGTTGYYYK